MQTRIRTKQLPSPAFNIEQLLFVTNGIIGVISSILQTLNTAFVLFSNLLNLFTPQQN